MYGVTSPYVSHITIIMLIASKKVQIVIKKARGWIDFVNLMSLILGPRDNTKEIFN